MVELSVAEKYYVFAHRELDPKAVAKTLGVRLPAVKKYLKEIESSFADNKPAEGPMVPRGETELAKVVTETKPEPKPSKANLFVMKKEKDGKKTTQAVVMTQAGSELGDDFNKSNRTLKDNPNVFMVPKNDS